MNKVETLRKIQEVTAEWAACEIEDEIMTDVGSWKVEDVLVTLPLGAAIMLEEAGLAVSTVDDRGGLIIHRG